MLIINDPKLAERVKQIIETKGKFVMENVEWYSDGKPEIINIELSGEFFKADDHTADCFYNVDEQYITYADGTPANDIDTWVDPIEIDWEDIDA